MSEQVMTDAEAKKVALRKKNTEAKRASRAREREEKERAEARRNSQTVEMYWAIQRQKLPAEAEAWFEREQRVFDLIEWMEDWRKGEYGVFPDDPIFLGLHEGIPEIEADVKAHGLCPTEIILLPQFWLDRNLTHLTTGSSPTSVFARFGIITGIPGQIYFQWQQFLQREFPQPQAPRQEHTIMYCTIPECMTPPVCVSKAIADEFARTQTSYRCHIHLEELKKDRSTIRDRQHSEREHNKMFDQYGRLKQQQ